MGLDRFISVENLKLERRAGGTTLGGAMLVKRIKLRWRIARALFVGIVVSLLIPELLAAFLLPRSWGGYTEMPTDTRGSDLS